jgi:hypothetical protein
MNHRKIYLAIDLGPESGRMLAAALNRPLTRRRGHFENIA